MWCKQCQQDVPAVPSPDTGAYCCPRCALELVGAAVPVATGDPREQSSNDSLSDCAPVGSIAAKESCGPLPAIDGDPISNGGPTINHNVELPPTFDPWEMEEELRHIHRVLAPQAAQAAPSLGIDRAYAPLRFDAAHGVPMRWSYPAMRQLIGQRLSSRTPGGWLATLVSFVLSVGLMAFAFGGVLLAWSLVTGRQDLWTIGMPIALVGQIVLLMGFILQMDRLWNDNRDTAAKLEHVDERLHDLKATADLLETSRGAGGANLYAQMPGTINSQVLLADLKSQLDLLTLKMGPADRAP